MTALVTADGRRATPGGWIYQLAGGMSLFSPADALPTRDGDDYVFEAKRTLFVFPQPDGKTALVRCDKQGARPSQIRVPKTAIAFCHDVAADELLTSCAAELSGLTLARGSERVN